MDNLKENYYGSLCTEMYEMLHPKAPQDELAFYLSYVRKGMSVLEPLCGSGRFLVPFLERGIAIKGVDNSREMLEKLLEKAPDAAVVQSDLEDYETSERFDYVFISSGSVSLFTDRDSCKAVLSKMRTLLKKGGTFVFAVDTVANREPDSDDYVVRETVETDDGRRLELSSKSRYDEATGTQYSPAVYALYEGDALIQREEMDFRTHLYALGEMESLLEECGFTEVATYASFDKDIARSNSTESFFYECRF